MSTDITTTVDTYLAMWNEDEPVRRAELVDAADVGSCERPVEVGRVASGDDVQASPQRGLDQFGELIPVAILESAALIQPGEAELVAPTVVGPGYPQ